MKKFLIILLGVVIINDVIAQNTLDKLGLSPGTPAAAAYSLRLLGTDYTGAAIRVRRSSDNTTQDIGFTGTGDLDTAALKAFTATNNGFVTTWYDQSGNGRNMTKTDINYQPQIIFNGALKYIGSRPAIDFAMDKGLVYSGTLNLKSIISVVKSEATVWPRYHAILDGSPRFGGILEQSGTNFHFNVYPVAVWKNGVSKATSESLSPVNEGMIAAITPQDRTVNQIFVGNYDGGNAGGSILENEIVTFSALLSTGISQVITCNQGSYYSITTNCTTAINIQPSPTARAECSGNILAPLFVSASGFNLTYQWFSNLTATNSGGTLISGATSDTFIPPATTVGTTWYYVEVSGSVGGMVKSNVSGAITVDALPVVSISPASTVINSGASATLTASGASSYLWGIDSRNPLDYVSSCKLAAGLRMLSSTYTGAALRLRRSSDNTEADFGFTGNDLDIASINTFLGAASGYCTTLYDQSGSGNNIVQPNPAQQPLFVSAGLNGKPMLRYRASGTISMYNNTNFPPPYSVVYAARQTGPSRGRVLAGRNNNWLLGWWGGSMNQAHFDGWVSPGGGAPSDNNAYVYSSTGTGSISAFYKNGTLLYNNGGGVTGPNGISINGSESSDAEVAELFVFNAVLANTARERIEASSGIYYGIFGAPPVAGPSLVVNPITTTTYNVAGSSVNGGCIVTESAVVTVLANPGLANFSDHTKIYFDGTYTLVPPTSNSSGTITYTSSNTAVATISGNTVTIIAAGTAVIKAVQAQTATYYSDSISATLTVTSVSVVTKNGQVSNTSNNYVSRNGALASNSGLSINGKTLQTTSNGDGLTSSNPSTSAYQIKQDFPASADGLYWIKNDNINSGTPFQIYADMTTDGGGWTLILCNVSPNPGWTGAQAILRNQNSPGVSSTYSIIGWADYIKRSSSGFQYMMDAQTRRTNGGIWTANSNYSFTSTSNANTNITLNTKFGTWVYADNDIEARMPWYAPGSQGIITTSANANGSWWGTLIAAGGWTPAPWLGSSVQNPGTIWYWVR